MTHALSQRGIRFAEDAPLSPLTSLRIGGVARLLVFPRTTEEVEEAAVVFRVNEVVPLVIGRGTNLIGPDGGLETPVLVMTGPGSSHVDKATRQIVAETGVPMPRLAKQAQREGLASISFMVGIPGNVGGGVAMNAGIVTGGVRDVATVLVRARLLHLDSLQVRDVSAAELGFSYRYSALQTGELVLLEATFDGGERRDPQEVFDEQQAILQHRRDRQPKRSMTSGSVFKSPATQPAGYLIERVGLKGAAFGGAQISPKHANWIVNRGNASEADVAQLINLVRERVLQELNVELELELRFLRDP